MSEEMRMASIVIDVIGFILLLILSLSSRKKSTQISIDQKLYNAITFSVMTMFVIDCVTWVTDGKFFTGDIIVLNVFNYLLYLLGPINLVLWCCYVDYKINKDSEKLKRNLWIYLIPFLINTILCIIQLFKPILFAFDENNFYYRLPLSWFTYCIPFVYIFHTTIYTIICRKRIAQRNFLPLLLYALFPTIGVLIQAIGGDFSTIYIGTAFSILVVNIKVQNDLGVTDFLTGLNNRRHLEDYLKNICQHLQKDELLYGIMIDIDDFKLINDNHGHAAGDRALEQLSAIFLKSVRYSDFVARYAGDEFVIIVKMTSDGDINRVLSALIENTKEFNENSDLPYHLEFSYGYSEYQIGEAYDTFLKRIDEEMYLNKNEKKIRKAISK